MFFGILIKTAIWKFFTEKGILEKSRKSYLAWAPGYLKSLRIDPDTYSRGFDFENDNFGQKIQISKFSGIRHSKRSPDNLRE